MLWKGFEVEAVSGFSPGDVIIRASSSWALREDRLRPQNFQKTMKMRPRKMAPPTPTTTPMTVFFVFVLMPDSVSGVSSIGDAVLVGIRDVATEVVW